MTRSRAAITTIACVLVVGAHTGVASAQEEEGAGAVTAPAPVEPALVAPAPVAPQPPEAATPVAPVVVPAADAPRALSPFGVRLVAEAGFIGVLSNFGAFGTTPTRIDFKGAAGQDVLAPYTRWSAELDLGRRHTVVFLIQPLSTEGTRTPAADERYEDVTFRGGVPVRTRFSFPFYRLSYLYEVTQSERGYLALGLTAQIRNAEYTYEQLDGTRFARSSGVGFVPASKHEASYRSPAERFSVSRSTASTRRSVC